MRNPAFEKSLPIALCLVLCGMGQERLYAGQYRFTTIADSADPRFARHPNFTYPSGSSSFAYNGTPAISDDGTVVFGATLTDGVSGIFAGNGGQLTTLVDTAGQFGAFSFEEISVNSAGTVAFRATLDTGVHGIFTVDAGGTITTIADSTGGFVVFQGVSINDAGAVVFYGRSLPDEFGADDIHGIYVGQGGPLTTIVEFDPSDPDDDVGPLLTLQQPSINNSGDVAFFGQYEGGEGIFVGNGTSLTRIVDTEVPFDRFVPEARSPINDAGMVAFVGESQVGEVFPDIYTVRGVYVYSNGAVTNIADNRDFDPSGLLNDDDLCDVMINGAGTVAFGGLYRGHRYPGIYTGPDPDADKVIAIGDLLDGSPVVDLRFWGQGLNDRGEIAFCAVTNSAIGIYRATPVPEPAGSVLMLGAALLMLWRRPAYRPTASDRSPSASGEHPRKATGRPPLPLVVPEPWRALDRHTQAQGPPAPKNLSFFVPVLDIGSRELRLTELGGRRPCEVGSCPAGDC